jgi:trafficking protein particle complex subunit 10
VNLCEDALLQYDELEALYSYVLKDKNLSWFGSFIEPGPQDDSSPLLSITKKPYRDLILANTISVFDFRVYLLTRQCLLLAKLGRVLEITRKAASFLGSFGRRLREMTVSRVSL